MPREILHGAREFIQHAAGFHGHNAHSNEYDYNNQHDLSSASNGHVPLGYRREVHVHTVLVPENGPLGLFSHPMTWFMHNWIPVLVGALLLGTLLYLLRKTFFRAARMARERGREFVEIGREKAHNLKYRAEDLAERGREKAQLLKRKAANVAEEGRDRALEMKDNLKRRANRGQEEWEDTSDNNRYIQDQDETEDYYYERPMRRRIDADDFEDIGQVELDKHRRGPEYAEYEDEIHTANNFDEDLIQERPIYADRGDNFRMSRQRPVQQRKRPSKVTTTVTTEVTDPRGISKKKVAKVQDDTIASSLNSAARTSESTTTE